VGSYAGFVSLVQREPAPAAPALPESGPCTACPLRPFVPKAGGGGGEAHLCQRPGISLNPHSASISLSLRQHIRLILPSSSSLGGQRLVPAATSLKSVGATQGWGTFCCPPFPQDPGSCHLAQLPAENKPLVST
jgi:hypothetical protein